MWTLLQALVVLVALLLLGAGVVLLTLALVGEHPHTPHPTPTRDTHP